MTAATWPKSRSDLLPGWSITRSAEARANNFVSKILWSDDTSFSVFGSGYNLFGVSFPELLDFEIDFSGKVVRLIAGDTVSSETIYHLLADQIFPRIITHEGNLVLHAAGVSIMGQAVLFIGPSGSGKSTLAASLRSSGHTLLGDDAMIISDAGGDPAVRAVYPSLRLFPDSIDRILDRTAEISPVASYTTKRNVSYGDARSDDALPVRAAFMLVPARGDTVSVEPMRPSEACMAFVEHSFWMDPTDLRRTKKRMVQASALAEGVPTFRLAYPRDYAALTAVHETLVGVLD